MSDDPRYRTSRWRATRVRVLDRDGWRCVAVHPGCRYKAPGALRRAGRFKAHVHHIIDPSEGGDFWDDHNLQSACSEFNIAERNRRQNIRAARALRDDAELTSAQPSRKW